MLGSGCCCVLGEEFTCRWSTVADDGFVDGISPKHLPRECGVGKVAEIVVGRIDTKSEKWH